MNRVTHAPGVPRTDSFSAKPRWWSGWRRVAPLLFPLVVLVATGVRGLDFGFHWDERMFQVGPVKHMVRTGILLPNYYGYPSLTYWINASAIAPDIPSAWSGPDRRQRLLAAMDSHGYLLRLRAIYLMLPSLSLVWVYWLVLRWRASPPEAFLAASFLGLSWEVAYHLRWGRHGQSLDAVRGLDPPALGSVLA